ncbi:hypothetical protein BN14_03163 [Rhizoctonia solani AG-1 IB]|uniref:Uncharacterized protein n=1 Tax=Thanatephorus cucumeris (strain AG1-IB / isolate 7/3/14) TaxID=1108050 RepID=M5BPT8_THACB|nr:hypothetical protein BN14_03163 [Rhizoctonia solani AG-1 IB]
MPELLRRRRSLMGYVLQPLVCHPRTQSRFILDFHSDKGRADVQNWYKYQGRNTRFTLLEYRKDMYGRVRHEFIVVRLDDTTLCRFDRRARDEERGYALRDEGVPAEDSAHVLSSFETEYKELRCTVAENRIRNKWPFDIGFAYRYDLKALKKASLCAAGIFATNANAEDKATKDLLRELESTWKHALRALMAPGFKLQPIWSFDDDNDEDEDPDGDFVFISTKEAADWEDGSRMITKEWESAWDECDTLVAQYAETATSTIMAMILERLTDVLPEQLRFGDGVKRSLGLDQSNNPSVQDFIRIRMQEHFEMVDMFGFGSFQELIATAEEAMYVIEI